MFSTVNSAGPVKIVADSTCDLSPDLIEKYGIEVVPLPVNLGDRPCLDGVDVHPGDVFRYYEETGRLATTSAPTPSYYEDLYRKWTEEGYSAVHLSISLSFTVTHNIALMAAEKFPDIYPVDSRNISSGMGILAIKAAQLRDEGFSAREIGEKLKGMTGRVKTSFILDTLQFMYKGGRCTGVQALGANLFKLKPCIEVKDGGMAVGKKYRGSLRDVLAQYIETKLKGRSDLDLDRILITHTVRDQALLDSVVRQVAGLQDFKEILPTTAGCSVSVHCGPNTLGLIYMTRDAGEPAES